MLLLFSSSRELNSDWRYVVAFFFSESGSSDWRYAAVVVFFSRIAQIIDHGILMNQTGINKILETISLFVLIIMLFMKTCQ